MKKVGLLCGREYSFPPAFIVKVNQLGKKEGVAAEFVKLGGTQLNEPGEYSVIVDRISHEIDYYRGYLKHAVLQGTYVINNPFWWTADDKFFNYSAATPADFPSWFTLAMNAGGKLYSRPQRRPTFFMVHS